MSGTRSRFPRAPVTEALIVAHGQPSDPAPPEAALADLAAQVAARLPGWHVRCATMAMPGRVRAQAAALSPGAVVYPFFMARGWFVTGKMAGEIGRTDLRMADPLGLDPGLARLAAQHLREGLAAEGLTNGDTSLILAAHGSGRGKAAAAAAHQFATRLRARIPGLRIKTGFVEQSPRIADAAAGIGDAGVCLPFFAMPGEHYQSDIPDALAAAGFRGALLPVIGRHRAVPALVARALRVVADPTASMDDYAAPIRPLPVDRQSAADLGGLRLSDGAMISGE